MAAVDLQLFAGTTTTKDLATGEQVKLLPPAGFAADSAWTKDGESIDAADVAAIHIEPGRSVEYLVTDGAAAQSATALVRWRPNQPTAVDITTQRGALKVSWKAVSDERKLSHYEVDLVPSPPIAQLPRKTTGARQPGQTARSILFRGLPNDFYTAKVTAVANYPGHDPAKSEVGVSESVEFGESRTATYSTGWRVFYALVAASFFIGGLLLFQNGPINLDEVVLDWWAVGVGAFIVIAAVAALAVIRKISDLLSGADGRLSTSKVNVALWTITVGFAVVTLTCINIGASQYGRDAPCQQKEMQPNEPAEICTDVDKGTAMAVSELGISDTFDEGLAANYLVLLGTPFAGLAGAKFIVNRQLRNGSQRVGLGEGLISEAFTDDNGDADLGDSQYLLFTIVLLFYFYATFLSSPFSLPELPWGLVGLTGISAATYLANKATNENGLTVDAMVPTSAPATTAAEVRVTGRNFTPDGSGELPNAGLSVMVGTKGAVVTSASNTEVVFTTPDDLSAGAYEVLITTAANVVGSAGDLQITAG